MFVADFCRELKNAEIELFSSFPSILMHEAEKSRNSSFDPSGNYARLLIKLEHLENLFFIERLLIESGEQARGDLLDVSVEIVSLTTIFWKERDQFHGLYSDFEWLVSMNTGLEMKQS
jgi:hypothetical protein